MSDYYKQAHNTVMRGIFGEGRFPATDGERLRRRPVVRAVDSDKYTSIVIEQLTELVQDFGDDIFAALLSAGHRNQLPLALKLQVRKIDEDAREKAAYDVAEAPALPAGFTDADHDGLG